MRTKCDKKYKSRHSYYKLKRTRKIVLIFFIGDFVAVTEYEHKGTYSFDEHDRASTNLQ